MSTEQAIEGSRTRHSPRSRRAISISPASCAALATSFEPSRRGTAQGVRLSGSRHTARRRDGLLWRRNQRSALGLRRHHQGHEGIAPQWVNRKPPRRFSGQERPGPRSPRPARRAFHRWRKARLLRLLDRLRIANGGKRQLVIRAGKSHKFTIPESEVPG